jgi:small conductance mechanosensitive channel
MPLTADLTEKVTNTLDKVSDVTGTKQVGELAGKASDYLVRHSAQIIGGTIVLMIGVVVSGWVARALSRSLERRQNLDPPERLLIMVVARLLMLSLTVAVVLDVCGYPLKAIIAGLGVLGIGIGFAMQGLLGNIIAGVTLIFTKPFRVGEYIEILGVQGLVSHMDIMTTTLLHTDQSRVVIPNHKIVGEILHNLGTARQVNVVVGVGYQTDLKKARHLILQILARNPRVLPAPAPIVAVDALRDSAIAISIKSWVKVADYEFAAAEINEAVVESFRLHQIEIPFPQHDIRIIHAPTAPAITSHE